MSSFDCCAQIPANTRLIPTQELATTSKTGSFANIITGKMKAPPNANKTQVSFDNVIWQFPLMIVSIVIFFLDNLCRTGLVVIAKLRPYL